MRLRKGTTNWVSALTHKMGLGWLKGLRFRVPKKRAEGEPRFLIFGVIERFGPWAWWVLEGVAKASPGIMFLKKVPHCHL